VVLCTSSGTIDHRINRNSNYFDLNNQYYILAALGSFTTSRIGFTGTLSYHRNKDFTASFVNFSSFSNTGGDADYLYILKEKSHGICLYNNAKNLKN
jgi:hypothetical protein